MKNTPIQYRQYQFYQCFVRNHTQAGTFEALIHDLDRIQSLGTDVLYLLPFHPIGEKKRKGSVGSPYSIQDYWAVDEALGGMEGLKQLIEQVHQRKMKLMMDIVFNHTSRDSVLLENHPEYFYRNDAGEFANRVGDWWDITDFDFKKSKALWTELIDILSFYAKLGVDGFRCDVASLVPIEFWTKARNAVRKINPKMIWLSESVHGGFVKYIRDCGYEAASESEIYQIFDIAYDYDVYPYMEEYLLGKRPLKDYLEGLMRQEEIYPKNYIKLKYAENHDIPRIASLVNQDLDKIKNWLAFLFFQKGAMMLYAGTEFASNHLPSLFEKDVFTKESDLSDYIQLLAKIKKQKIFRLGIQKIIIPNVDGVAVIEVQNAQERWIGIFNVGQSQDHINLQIPDGSYQNLLTKQKIVVQHQHIALTKDPIILRLKGKIL